MEKNPPNPPNRPFAWKSRWRMNRLRLRPRKRQIRDKFKMRRADLSRAICLGYGYRRHGLCEPRCPECGRAFNPEDQNTFLDRRRPNVWFQDIKQAGFWAYWAKPPPTWQVLVVLFVTLIFLEMTSIGGGFYGVFAVSSYPRIKILLLCGWKNGKTVWVDRHEADKSRKRNPPTRSPQRFTLRILP